VGAATIDRSGTVRYALAVSAKRKACWSLASLLVVLVFGASVALADALPPPPGYLHNAACALKREGDLCRERPTDALDGVCTDDPSPPPGLRASDLRCDPFASVADFAVADAGAGTFDASGSGGLGFRAWLLLAGGAAAVLAAVLVALRAGNERARRIVRPVAVALVGVAAVATLVIGALWRPTAPPTDHHRYAMGERLPPSTSRDICRRGSVGLGAPGFTVQTAISQEDLLHGVRRGRDILLARADLWPDAGPPVIGEFTVALDGDTLGLLWWTGPCVNTSWGARAVTRRHVVLFDQRGLAHVLSIDDGAETMVVAVGERVHAAAGAPDREEVWFDTSTFRESGVMGTVDLDRGTVRQLTERPSFAPPPRTRWVPEPGREVARIGDVSIVEEALHRVAKRRGQVLWDHDQVHVWAFGDKLYELTMAHHLVRADPQTGRALATFMPGGDTQATPKH
jgi:hypothetical protein